MSDLKSNAMRDQVQEETSQIAKQVATGKLQLQVPFAPFKIADLKSLPSSADARTFVIETKTPVIGGA